MLQQQEFMKALQEQQQQFMLQMQEPNIELLKKKADVVNNTKN